MTGTPKKKLCWNCEGRVNLDQVNCPYCAVYLGPAPDQENEPDALSPPYKLVETEDESVPASPYAAAEEKQEEPVAVDLTESKRDLKKVILPLALMSAGSMFSLFGLILWIFSEHGTFTLTWNGDHWYVYVLIALPMLLIGWRTLYRFEEEPTGQA